jgi:hypothetical protein
MTNGKDAGKKPNGIMTTRVNAQQAGVLANSIA